MSFHETNMGKIFFEYHMPQLVKSLQSISDSLERKTSFIKLPLPDGYDILKELYLGNYEASVFKETAASAALNHTVIEKQERLVSGFTKDMQKLFDEYCEATGKRNSAVIEQAYKSGFSTAVQMMFAGLIEPAGKEAEDENS